MEVRVSSEQYCNELSGVVALPDRCKCSLMEYANRIRVAVLSEQSKINPDNSLISLLCDAARIGYEYGECAQGNLELAQQYLTQQGSEPSEIFAIADSLDDMNQVSVYDRNKINQHIAALRKLLPC